MENAFRSPGWGFAAFGKDPGHAAPAGEEGEGDTMTGHAYIGYRKGRCQVCGETPNSPAHSYTLAGMETADADREASRQLTQAAELSELMLQPGRDISAKAGRLERESPLFFGTGNSPTLF
jgi:hypothetical protein